MACVSNQPANKPAMVQHTLVGKLAVSPVSFQVQKVLCLFQALELIVDPTYFLGQFQAVF
jgi:hypothetical protein